MIFKKSTPLRGELAVQEINPSLTEPSCSGLLQKEPLLLPIFKRR